MSSRALRIVNLATTANAKEQELQKCVIINKNKKDKILNDEVDNNEILEVEKSTLVQNESQPNEVKSAEFHITADTITFDENLHLTPERNEHFSDFDSDDTLKDPDYEMSEDENDKENHEQNPETEVGDEGETSFNQETPKGRKRKANPKAWKRNLEAEARHEGLEFETKTKRIVERKRVKLSCPDTCKLKCKENIPEAIRQSINSKYWNNQKSIDMKRQFVASRVEQIPIKRNRVRSGEREGKRQFSNCYTFEVNGLKVAVCKNFFLNTLCISQQSVDTALKKKRDGGLVTPDKRGKQTPSNKISEAVRNGVRRHISKFPAYESHYSREKTRRKYLGNHLNISRMYQLYLEDCKDIDMPDESIAKQWLYAEIFNYEYNYSFKSPDTDTCDACDQFQLQLQQASIIEEKTVMQEDYEKHLADATNRYSLKSEDKHRSRQNNSEKVIMIDLQKCLPTPELHNSQSFYSLKLWTYNLTIHDSTTQKCFCMMWDESVSGRGGNEVASCLLKFVSFFVSNEIELLTTWSDNCPSQNRNSQMIMCYIWMLKSMPNLKVVEHKFLARGHTHLEADADHSAIERERKKLPQLRIVTPWDWQQVVRLCSVKNPFTVVNMEVEDFKNFKKLYEGSSAPFVMKKKSEDNEDFLISKIVQFQVRQSDPGVIFFKTSFDEITFRKLDLNRRSKRNTPAIPENLHQIRNNARPISTKKYNHLQKLLSWVPKTFHNFFKNLPHGEGEEDSD